MLDILNSGIGTLAAYLAAHVILCLIPAFVIAGALSSVVPKGPVSRLLGPAAPMWQSYPAAALGGFILAVCSCTIMPLFAGILRNGAGLGPAITFLFVGPAINILALSLTSVQLGTDLAVARLVLSITFGIGIGLIMAAAFGRRETGREGTGFEEPPAPGMPTNREAGGLLLILLGILIAGTFQTPWLTDSMISVQLDIPAAGKLQKALTAWVQPDQKTGVEGVTVQGILIIGLLAGSAFAGWRGFSRVEELQTHWTWAALVTVAVTVIIASLSMEIGAEGLSVGITGRTLVIVLLLYAVGEFSRRHLSRVAISYWLSETWRFAGQIIPLLLVGVFVAGMARMLIPSSWVQAVAGANTLVANFAGVAFGIFMYFPTLVEVPVAQTFLSLGMHKGPLLAYLMADPELSLQSMLVTSSILGRKKTGVYVLLVGVFSTVAGYLFGIISG